MAAEKADKKVPPASTEIDRALKCPPCSLRDAVVANLQAGAYARSIDIEDDLLALESMPK